MGTYTTNKNLFMPTVGETGWGDLVNNNFSTIDTYLKPISLSGSTYTFTGNQTGGTITATKITNSGTLTQTGTSTFTGKITANGGIGTKALSATSITNSGNMTNTGTLTSTGKIYANGGLELAGSLQLNTITVTPGDTYTTPHSAASNIEDAMLFCLPKTFANYTGSVKIHSNLATRGYVYYRLGTAGGTGDVGISAYDTYTLSFENVDSVYLWVEKLGYFYMYDVIFS